MKTGRRLPFYKASVRPNRHRNLAPYQRQLTHFSSLASFTIYGKIENTPFAGECVWVFFEYRWALLSYMNTTDMSECAHTRVSVWVYATDKEYFQHNPPCDTVRRVWLLFSRMRHYAVCFVHCNKNATVPVKIWLMENN